MDDTQKSRNQRQFEVWNGTEKIQITRTNREEQSSFQRFSVFCENWAARGAFSADFANIWDKVAGKPSSMF